MINLCELIAHAADGIIGGRNMAGTRHAHACGLRDADEPVHPGARREGDMFEEDLQVLPHRRGWAVKRERALKAISVHPIRADAVSKAQRIASRQGVRVILLNDEGTTPPDQRSRSSRHQWKTVRPPPVQQSTVPGDRSKTEDQGR